MTDYTFPASLKGVTPFERVICFANPISSATRLSRPHLPEDPDASSNLMPNRRAITTARILDVAPSTV